MTGASSILKPCLFANLDSRIISLESDVLMSTQILPSDWTCNIPYSDSATSATAFTLGKDVIIMSDDSVSCLALLHHMAPDEISSFAFLDSKSVTCSSYPELSMFLASGYPTFPRPMNPITFCI